METMISKRNPKIIHMKRLGVSREYRRQSREFLCDGEKLLSEAVSYGARITAVLSYGDTAINLPDDVPVYHTNRELIETVSPLKNPQNILFSCEMRDEIHDITYDGHQIILDGIQDPGNLGTIIRTANAFSINTVILINGCADPYNPKTIRATMGAMFKQRVIETDLAGIRQMVDGGLKIYGATLGEDCCDIRNAKFENTSIAVGNEGNGLSEELLDLCFEKIMIPMNSNCESLNAAVAAAILMWEIKKSDCS